MKYMKLTKRLFVTFMSTCIIFSSVFFSYSNTLMVKAVEEIDLYEDAVTLVLGVIGVFALPEVTVPAVATYLGWRIQDAGFDTARYLQENVTDNGDGTTTISEDFVQLTLQAYNDYVKESFDGTLNYNQEGLYYEYGPSVFRVDFLDSNNFEGFVMSEMGGFSYTYPIALFLENGIPDGNYTRYKVTPYFFNGNTASENGGIFEVNDYKSLFVEIPTGVMTSCMSASLPASSYDFIGLQFAEPGIPAAYSSSCTLSCSTIPVYTSYEFMKADLQSGKFTNAENLRLSGQTSMYTGSYGGGDITVQTEKLGNIEEKLDEINETGKSIDDKLKDLLDWLGIGSGTGGTGGGIAPSHWYDAVLDYLDKILKQLKSIKRWTIIDTFIDGVDAIADWLDLIHDILSDVDDGMESAVSTLSSALDDATGLLKTKFPFSVPWDIFFFVTLLAAEPEVPHFEAPIDFDVSAIDMHVHYDFVVDFTDYQYLSDIFRVILSMTYAVGLLKMTAGIVSTKKEE